MDARAHLADNPNYTGRLCLDYYRTKALLSYTCLHVYETSSRTAALLPVNEFSCFKVNCNNQIVQLFTASCCRSLTAIRYLRTYCG